MKRVRELKGLSTVFAMVKHSPRKRRLLFSPRPCGHPTSPNTVSVSMGYREYSYKGCLTSYRNSASPGVRHSLTVHLFLSGTLPPSCFPRLTGQAARKVCVQGASQHTWDWLRQRRLLVKEKGARDTREHKRYRGGRVRLG
jgi:hypothetical protein